MEVESFTEESSKLYADYAATQDIGSTQANPKISAWIAKYFKCHIQPQLPKNRNAKILDIGCGYGKYLIEMKKAGYTSTNGIDISESQIKAAKSHHGLNNVEKAEPIAYLENQKDAWDCILLFDILEHLPLDYLLTLMPAVHAALKPGGKVIVQVPNGISPMSPYTPSDITHYRAFSVFSLAQTFRKGGFSVFEFAELAPVPLGFKGAVSRMIWKLLFAPFCAFCMLVANSSKMGGIYTANLLGTATK